MQFVYDKSSKNEILELVDENYNYIIKARRHKIDDEIYFRNLEDDFIYLYKIVEINKKSATLTLVNSEKKVIENSRKLHLVWCVVDPKIVEKSISSLNEIGVDKITFVYSDFSQKNFKINIEKLNKILINSSSQCGRSSIIKLEISKSLDGFLAQNPKSYILDFSNSFIDDKKDDIDTLVIGCEGGFSKREKGNFNKDFVVGFNSNLILRSETAIVSATSKILL
ncbi:16S rRNA (uracil(1498)-N(3))-methyltransferase [Aliarcobacter skirrowii]|uniref:Ribosomal RNA small subunit methyltransferase E n=1 Tax=Aliarcobacter skirrowii TaxID=28200 RepID=A0A2U2C2Z0_9BACT|nr:16S rRNA (uracil(1498)-N(3))-methyltransferase [Aliarcobacter skirrowii]PWE22756.1 16S rRNA (uracil(1498)-N(3))-methyltransferase [Aliarcobacter skirrowii]PWE23368.1 16S rRNA (uracil(1498)-N(3))-methyltransferase [Aliarcobacter skirrowii]PWE26041.1 16S rRNA (uracil(1498)-N(3))-methyltransferase [Aliarcobacter skirrowii]RJO56595.1 16S rRNA (uracil(1498)-N(3))-methyltransferase [Aliarcobacter skirrowii]RJO58549.1 16S rRNA (uracil(1498)-N(3))-methyltransferase [Aliarcobacter skirrowii]